MFQLATEQLEYKFLTRFVWKSNETLKKKYTLFKFLRWNFEILS